MPNIITNPDGSIDWNANGWPEPNPFAIYDDSAGMENEMPDDIFEVWLNECLNMDADGGIDE